MASYQSQPSCPLLCFCQIPYAFWRCHTLANGNWEFKCILTKFIKVRIDLVCFVFAEE